jgi:ribonucleotide reductase beta subunit family protein with ferritin-like domain
MYENETVGNETEHISKKHKKGAEYKTEPMTVDHLRRYSLFPIEHEDIYNNYKQQLARFWDFQEIDFSNDAKSWNTMNKHEQNFIANVLAYFANSDNIVMENLERRFKTEITWPEAQLALSTQSFFEGIHVVSYNLMIDTVIKDKDEKRKLFESIKYNPIIQKKLDWCLKWVNAQDTPLHVCFVAWAIVEGIFFATSFAAILWLRQNQRTPGICFSNEKIIEDECLHVKLSAMLKRKCVNIMKTEDVHQMMKEAVSIEQEFIDKALPYKLKGMNATLMKQYVCKVADTILVELNEPTIYNVSNPFPWMENIGLMGKTNFFEKRVSEYNKVQKEDEIKQKVFLNLGEDVDF